LFMDYRRRWNLQTKIIRIFNTYGPNMHENDGRVVSNFIIQALKNEPITIYGRGDQTRSFCYVTDLLEGAIKVMGSNCSDPINLGNPDEITILELAEKIKELTNSKSELIFKPLPSDDPKRRKPDIALAKKEINWNPIVDLHTGLLETISYFQK